MKTWRGGLAVYAAWQKGPAVSTATHLQRYSHSSTATGADHKLDALKLAAAGGLAALAVGISWSTAQPAHARDEAAKPASKQLAVKPQEGPVTKAVVPPPAPQLPPVSDQGAAADKAAAGQRYTKEEVAKHRTKADGIWVTYKDGVYDITDFVDKHPGGSQKIMLAAGASIDPFWKMYQQHNKPEIRDILTEYRIGTLEGYSAPAAGSMVDPYQHEPARHPALIGRSNNPCNAETPGHILASSPLTPADMFYVRNHLPVPTVDPASYRLTVEGQGLRTLELSLADLRSTFKKYSVAATVQCGGNRRNEMKAVKPVKGLDWDIGAIGTATWSGVRLRDVLKHAGLSEEEAAATHVKFLGLDTDPASGEHYETSIPIDWAFSSAHDVILAYEMNGQELSRDHGFPLRVVVPGVVGARSVKWLSKIEATTAESSSHWQQLDYKAFNPSVDWDTVDWSSAPAIQEPPVTSAICEPAPGQKIDKDFEEIKVLGYAWSGGGRDIIRLDVTLDGGKSWTSAPLTKLPQQPHKAWAWTLWEVRVPIPAGHTGPLEIMCKATDAAYNTQPDSVSGIWNLRGMVNNAWHRVKVEIV